MARLIRIEWLEPRCLLSAATWRPDTLTVSAVAGAAPLALGGTSPLTSQGDYYGDGLINAGSAMDGLDEDWGDAPAPFPTAIPNGARHVAAGPRLGSNRDTETDGLPSANADGDDLAGSPDDEDGVTFLSSSLFVSTNAASSAYVRIDLQNADPTSNRLDGWVDFNRDGDWSDSGEQVFASFDLGTGDGLRTLSFAIPRDTGSNVELGSSFARFRVSTAGSLGPGGSAGDGEVEDYAVTLAASSEVTGTKWNDLDLDGVRDAGEPGLAGWTIYLDTNGNGRLDPAEPTGITDVNGSYLIAGMGAGTYSVAESMLNGWKQTSPAMDSLQIDRISLSTGGVQGNNESYEPSITDDGQYIAFWSLATTLVTGDTNNAGDVFLRNRQTGTTQRLSVGVGGVEANDQSTSPSITPDGRFVTFVSRATNLVSGDTNAVADIFVLDRQSGITERVSVSSAGAQANSESSSPAITPDGRYVAFYSAASNLDANDTNGQYDIFVYDRQLDSIERVSLGLSSAAANGSSYGPSISADGRWVAFYSSATNLVLNDTNAVADIFVADRQLDTIERVSIGWGGSQADATSYAPAISADGRYVAFQSDATNLIALDTNAKKDIFVFDRDLDRTERVSVAEDGKEANDNSISPALSADGRYVAYESDATNLVSGDTNAVKDVFVMDRLTYAVRRASLAPSGTQVNYSAYDVALSASGEFAAFHSLASTLVTGDTNSRTDVFVARAPLQGTRTVTLAAGGQATAIDFGNRALVGQIRGTKWNDVDGDRVWDAGESALQDWTIFLDTNRNRQIDPGETTTQTDANGQYVFPNLTDGRYSVAEFIPSGWGQTSPGDTSFLPLFQASIRDQPPDGTGDSFNTSTNWLISQTTSAENRVVAEFDTALIAGHRVASALLDFELFINNSGGDTSRPFSFYLYGGNGAEELADFSVPAVFAGSVTHLTSDGTRAYQLNVASALQQVLDSGATYVGLRVDPTGSNTFATGIQKIRLTAAAPAVGGLHDFMLSPGQIRQGVDFGNRDVVPYIKSITRAQASPTTAGTVDFTVTFSEDVTGVGTGDFAVTANGPAGASVASVAGAGKTYTVTVNTGSGDGTLRLDVVDDDTIRDAGNNPLEGAGAGNGNYTKGQSYVIDRELPTVIEVLRASPNPTRAATVNFSVRLSEPVTGVDTSDFSLTVAGLSGAGIQSVSGSEANYTVTVNTGSGQGTVRLNVLANGTVLDTANHPLSGAFSGGQVYDVDRVAPVVTSITRLAASPTSAASVQFRVAFSEPVTGVDVADFVTNTVGPTGTSVQSVAGSGAEYTVTVATGSGDGRIRLDLIDNDTILDAVGNTTASGFSTGEVYVVDRADPAVVSIVRTDANPTTASSVRYTVTFSEPVTGVTSGDFSPVVSGLAGAAVTGVTGANMVCTVTVNTGSGNGSLRLDLVDDDSIIDGAGRPLGGAGLGNGNYAGQVYSVFTTPGIYGTKWNDLDTDGVWDAGEMGIVGITIYLDQNQNGILDAGEPTTLTVADNPATTDIDETGRYQFTGLAAGVYVVGEVIPEHNAQTHPPVAGGTGRLTFVSAVVDGTSGVDGLAGADGVAVSPDGKHVYATGETDDAVSVFSRHPATGALTFLQTINHVANSTYGLDGAQSVAITPDGTQALVVSNVSDALVVFNRNTTTGLLTYRQSLKDSVSPNDGLDGAIAIALSPDGVHAYVTGTTENALSVFRRDGVTGNWSFVQVFKDGVNSVDGLSGARAVAVSPDGVHVYTAAFSEDKLAIFSRDGETGQLTYRGVVQDNNGGIDGLDGAVGVSVSPDGSHVYVAGQNDDAVAVFQRTAANHTLTYVQRVKDGTDVDGILRSSSVTVAADGRHVYATGYADNGVAVFSRNASSGSLTYVESRKDGQSGVTGINSAWAVTASPDNNHVYVAGKVSNAVAAFAREAGVAARAHRIALSAGQVVIGRDFANYHVPLQVTAIEPAHGAILNSIPAKVRVDFNLDVAPASVDAGDLTVNGISATGFTLVDADTVDFLLPALGEGLHTVAIAAGSILHADGPPLLAFQSQFTTDLTAPQVTIQSLVTTDSSPALSGTVNDATAVVRVTLRGRQYTVTNNGNGTWTLADNSITVLVPYGIHEVAVTATDPAGNVGQDATTNELEVVRSLLSISGPASIVEGSSYAAVLAHHASIGPMTSWTIDWGDGTSETLPGDPASASHTYADGTLGYAIRATARNAAGDVYTSSLTVSPDPTFGVGGYVATPVQALSSSSKLDIAIQPDGKILAIGQDGASGWVLARYLPDGTADAGFGAGGSVVSSFPGLADTYTMPRAVALQSDGKILVVGNASYDNWAMLRFHTDGAPDSTFGTSGRVLVDRNRDSRPNDVLVDAQGRAVLAGTEWLGSGSHVVVARFTTTGSLDTTFDGDGVVTTGEGDTVYEGADAIALTRDGGIIAAGYYNLTSTTWVQIARYTSDGRLDAAFNSDGIYHGSFSGASAYARAVEVDAADRVVFAADLIYPSTDDDWAVGRLTPNGMPDVSFDTDGRVTLDISNTDDKVYDLAVQGDGRVLVAGNSFVTGNGSDLALARFHADGRLDTTLAGDGTWVMPPRASVWESLHAVAIDAHDRLVALAGAQAAVELARYETNAGWIARVNNVAPTLGATGAAAIAEGLTYTLNLSASDPGTDTIEYWTVDWGDGYREYVNGTMNQVRHVYAQGGFSRAITVKAKDEDGEYAVAGPVVSVSVAARGEIRGVKWHDADGDGVRDTNETGMGGVTIYVDVNDNSRFDAGEPSTVTWYDDPATTADEAGSYVLTNIVQGTHLVAEVLAPERTQTYPGVQAEPLERVSLTAAGAQGSGDSEAGQISDDGRYVAFRSAARLLAEDTNDYLDVYVYDRQLNLLVRGSANANGSQWNRQTSNWSLSGSGRVLAMDTWVPNGSSWFTVRNLDSTTQVLDMSSTSYDSPSLNAAGNYVSYTQELTLPDYNVYLRNLPGSTWLASRTSAGAKGNNNSGQSSVSDDGQFVVFTSHATNLVASDTNSRGDVFFYERGASSVTRISVSSAGGQSDGDSYLPDINADGRYVAFSSAATNLVAGDTNAVDDVFVKDRQTGVTERVSVATDGLQGNGISYGASISADGRYVLFLSYATNLVAGDTNGVQDLFLRDRVAGTTERISLGGDGAQANGASGLYAGQRALSANGRYIAFASSATNLVPGDTNGYSDTFVTPTTAARRAGTHQVTVLAGQSTVSIDFGSRGPVGEIRGTLWRDTDGDGVRDAGETSLTNRTVFLDLNRDDRLSAGEPTRLTDANGDYAFVNLPPGTYDVLEVPVVGWEQTSPQPYNGDFTYLTVRGNDHVYDAQRELLYLTGTGQVLRYDVNSRAFLTPHAIGASLIRGADITPDGKYLYVAGGDAANEFHKIDLDTGAIQPITYTPAFMESVPWDVGIASDGYGFLTTRFSGSGTVPLRRLQLSNDALTELGTTDQDRNIWRSADYSRLVFGSFVFAPQIYNASTSSFQTVVASVFDDPVTINRDNSLIAVAGYRTLLVYDNTLTNVVFSTGNYDYNGGVAFDPVRDLLYVGNSATNEVVAFDTRTWQIRFRFNGFANGVQRFQEYSEGLVSTSSDGRLLFVSTGQGTQVARLTPRHRVALSPDAVVTGKNFGDQLQAFRVAASDPPHNALLNTAPSQLRVVFNDAIDASTVQATDLVISGTAATGFTIENSTTVVFQLPPLTHGTHTAMIAAGAVLSALGDPVAANQILISVDTQAPVVTVTPLTSSDASPPLSGTVDDATATILVQIGTQSHTATNNGNGTWTLPDNTINPPLTAGRYNVQVTATDPAGNVGQDASSGELLLVLHTATDIGLSNSAVNENLSTQAADLLFGQLSSVDADPEDQFTYELVAGTGGTDNARFRITGNNLYLRQNEVLDFETRPSYSVRVRTTDLVGHVFEKPLSLSVNNLVEIQGVQVGDGTTQRSRVESVSISFDSLVTISAGAFLVTKRGASGGAVAVSYTTREVGGKTIADLTFSGGLTEYGSLKDGYYELRIDASKILGASGFGLDSNRDGVTGDDYRFGDDEADNFFRLYGDTNGDGLVGIVEFGQFRATFGKTPGQSGYDARFDFDGGGVGITDFGQFRARFGKPKLPWE